MYAMVLVEQCFDVQVFVLAEIMYVFIYKPFHISG